jgi:hypothetical protein
MLSAGHPVPPRTELLLVGLDAQEQRCVVARRDVSYMEIAASGPARQAALAELARHAQMLVLTGAWPAGCVACVELLEPASAGAERRVLAARWRPGWADDWVEERLFGRRVATW